MVVRIPDIFKERLYDAPESHYGVVNVTIILKDGREFRNVEVSWDDEILKCGGSIHIPFTADEIVDVRIERGGK